MESIVNKSFFSYNTTSFNSSGQEGLLYDPGGILQVEFHSNYSTDLDLGVNSTTAKSIVITTMVTTTVGFFPLGLGLLIVCVLGLTGNILSAIVLARPKMKSTYSILTLGLTFCDTVYLLTKLLRYGLLSLFVHCSVAYSYTEVMYPILGPYLRALTFTAHTGSTYFTVALAIDRYISVCWPVKARFLCTKRRAHVLVIIVFTFSILYNLTRWIEFHTKVSVHYDQNTDTNLTFYSMEISCLRKNPVYKTYYIFWAYFFVMFCVPFVSLTFFNFAIFQKVRESNRTREKLTSYQKREISFAMMLLSIVAVFLLTSVDYLILDLLTYFHQPYSSFWDQLGNFLLTLNSAVNFTIYCAFGRKFRQEFYQVLREVSWRREQSPKTASSRNTNNSGSGNCSKNDAVNFKETSNQKLCECRNKK